MDGLYNIFFGVLLSYAGSSLGIILETGHFGL